MADMKELLLNMFDIGIGVTTLTKKKLEELQKEVVEKGRMTRRLVLLPRPRAERPSSAPDAPQIVTTNVWFLNHLQGTVASH